MLAVAALLVVATVGWVVVRSGTSDDEARDPTGPSATPSPTTTPSAVEAPAPTAATRPDADGSGPADVAGDVDVPVAPIEVVEVWLLDGGDGSYDWGLTLTAADGTPPRSGVGVDVRLIGDDGRLVSTIEREVDGVASSPATVVAGRLARADRVPVRLEFDVTVGEESSADRPLSALLSTRALGRVGDEVTVRVRSVAESDLVDVLAVLVWRDDGGEVAAVASRPIERLRPGVDARFALDLAGSAVPSGPPDEIMWTAAG